MGSLAVELERHLHHDVARQSPCLVQEDSRMLQVLDDVAEDNEVCAIGWQVELRAVADVELSAHDRATLRLGDARLREVVADIAAGKSATHECRCHGSLTATELKDARPRSKAGGAARADDVVCLVDCAGVTMGALDAVRVHVGVELRNASCRLHHHVPSVAGGPNRPR